MDTIQAYEKMIEDAIKREDNTEVAVLRSYYEAEKKSNRFGAHRNTWESVFETSAIMREFENHENRFSRMSALADKIAAVVIGGGIAFTTIICPIMVGLM